MTTSVVIGVLLVIAGTILSLALIAPESGWLLTIFLTFVIISLMLGIMKKWDAYSLVGMVILVALVVTIGWGEHAKLGVTISGVPFSIQLIVIGRAIGLICIWLGAQEFLSLFRHYNYHYVEDED